MGLVKPADGSNNVCGAHRITHKLSWRQSELRDSVSPKPANQVVPAGQGAMIELHSSRPYRPWGGACLLSDARCSRRGEISLSEVIN
jgi:hypothetical protein